MKIYVAKFMNVDNEKECYEAIFDSRANAIAFVCQKAIQEIGPSFSMNWIKSGKEEFFNHEHNDICWHGVISERTVL